MASQKVTNQATIQNNVCKFLFTQTLKNQNMSKIKFEHIADNEAWASAECRGFALSIILWLNSDKTVNFEVLPN